MGVIGNYSLMNKTCGRFMGGVAEANTRSNYDTPGSIRNQWVGSGIDQKSGLPNGYRESASWNVAIKDGGMSTHYPLVSGAAAVAASIAGGVNGVAPITGSGTISNANLALVVQALAALTGNATVVANINAQISAVAALSGSGTVTNALLSALGALVAALTGSGTPTSTLNAGGTLGAAITVTGDLLNTANVAAAVWDATASLHSAAGTLGGELADVDTQVAAIMGRLPAALVGGKMDSTLSSGERDAIATALLDLANSIDTSVTVRGALRAIASGIAGKTSGLPTSPVFRNISNSKDVISATLDGSGNRTAVTVDLT